MFPCGRRSRSGRLRLPGPAPPGRPAERSARHHVRDTGGPGPPAAGLEHRRRGPRRSYVRLERGRPLDTRVLRRVRPTVEARLPMRAPGRGRLARSEDLAGAERPWPRRVHPGARPAPVSHELARGGAPCGQQPARRSICPHVDSGGRPGQILGPPAARGGVVRPPPDRRAPGSATLSGGGSGNSPDPSRNAGRLLPATTRESGLDVRLGDARRAPGRPPHHPAAAGRRPRA